MGDKILYLSLVKSIFINRDKKNLFLLWDFSITTKIKNYLDDKIDG